MSERSDHDRLRRVEVEVEGLLADVREQVKRLRATVERIRALRGSSHPPTERAPADGGRGWSERPGGRHVAPRYGEWG